MIGKTYVIDELPAVEFLVVVGDEKQLANLTRAAKTKKQGSFIFKTKLLIIGGETQGV